MPWLEQRPNGQYHLSFRFGGRKLKKSLRTKDARTAEARLRQVEENIRLLEKGRIELPDDADVVEFLLSDGKLDGKQRADRSLRTLRQFGEAFMNGIPENSLEVSTLKGMRIHLDHLYRCFGRSFLLTSLTLCDLQKYVDCRSKASGLKGRKLSPATIKKELTTLRTLWNWARNAGFLVRAFPSRGLRYPKMADKPSFQTWAEINRKIDAYKPTKDEQSNLWECLFLTTSEVSELLADVKQKALPKCVYPMFVFAAHTGCRRSEMLRSVVDDIDLTGRTLTIQEKKRVRGRLTTRSVPISDLLLSVLAEWLSTHPGRGPTFVLDHDDEHPKIRANSHQPLTYDEAQYYFKRALAETNWSPIRGWHVFGIRSVRIVLLWALISGLLMLGWGTKQRRW
jgi:integrase